MNNIGKTITFCEMIKQNAIFIPKIQRDYVQYRKSNEANLNGLLEKLVVALKENKEINLNFIYGYCEKTKINPNTDSENTLNVFIPIDGQQRLTTLFLLHYYVFSKSRKGVDELKNKLIYDTRESTNEFIKLLLDKSKDIFDDDVSKSIDEKIKNYSWYCSEWDYDASIKSMLLVLGKIKDAFEKEKVNDFECYAQRLSTRCPIKFMIMEIDVKYGNELYIKMNARGKQLTPFENFKADLLGYLKNEKVNWVNDIANGLDGTWQNKFFKLWEEDFKNDLGGEMAYIDLFFKKFFHYFIINYYLLNGAEVNEEKWNRIKNIDADNSFFDNYESILCKDKLVECIENLNSTFVVLCNLEDSLFYKVLSDIFSIKNNDESKVMKNNRFVLSMPQRAFFYAFYCMGKDAGESKEFEYENYWRITENLINNAEIDDIDSLCECLNWFNKDSLFKQVSQYEHEEGYARNCWGNALRGLQIHEEKIKLELRKYSDDWKNVIREAEEISYFRGEIYFLLRASRNDQGYDLEKFKSVLTKIKNIFAGENGISDENSILLHKLLLTLHDREGVYPEKTSNRGENNYILNYYRNNEKHHDQDWRGLFRKYPEIIYALNDFDTKKEFNKFVDGKIQNATISNCLDRILVRHFDLINSYYRVWFYDGKYRLLKGANRDKYLDCQFIEKMDEKAKGKEITFTFGSNSDRQTAEINKKKIYYKDGKYSSNDEELSQEKIDEYLNIP